MTPEEAKENAKRLNRCREEADRQDAKILIEIMSEQPDEMPESAPPYRYMPRFKDDEVE